MAFNKNELFSKDLQDCSIMFKALAHPARLAILKFLAETKTCITGDLAAEIPLGRTTVNQHLRELRNAGLIQGTTEGVKTCYCLDGTKVQKLKKLTEEFLSDINTDMIYECK